MFNGVEFEETTSGIVWIRLYGPDGEYACYPLTSRETREAAKFLLCPNGGKLIINNEEGIVHPEFPPALDYENMVKFLTNWLEMSLPVARNYMSAAMRYHVTEVYDHGTTNSRGMLRYYPHNEKGWTFEPTA